MIRAVVLDIEGTTSALNYVRKHLFRYSYDIMAAWLSAHGDEPEVAAALREAAAIADRPTAHPRELVPVLREWIDQDAKVTPLKTIQGLIWSEGLQSGQLRAHVYPDVPPAIANWWRQGLVLHVYSSGSVVASRSWFRHTECGDLSEYITNYFDTANAGPKQDWESYQAISRSIDVPPAGTVFLSDVPAELAAARSAGWWTVLVQRPDSAPPPNSPPAPADQLRVQTFDQLDLAGERPVRSAAAGDNLSHRPTAEV